MARTKNVSKEFYIKEVLVKLENATDEVVRQFALRVQERAALNIRANDQIDTGFMVNSIYVKWKGGTDYTKARSAAGSNVISSRTGKAIDHQNDFAPEVALISDAIGAVVVGARYAIYQERLQPFLLPAAERTASEFGVVATAIYERIVKD